MDALDGPLEHVGVVLGCPVAVDVLTVVDDALDAFVDLAPGGFPVVSGLREAPEREGEQTVPLVSLQLRFRELLAQALEVVRLGGRR